MEIYGTKFEITTSEMILRHGCILIIRTCSQINSCNRHTAWLDDATFQLTPELGPCCTPYWHTTVSSRTSISNIAISPTSALFSPPKPSESILSMSRQVFLLESQQYHSVQLPKCGGSIEAAEANKPDLVIVSVTEIYWCDSIISGPCLVIG